MLVRLTRGGVAYNLEDSPYGTTIDYVGAQITYSFSSDLHRRMFSEKLEKNRNDINTSLSNRFGFSITNDILCDVKLYSAVENRGFLIIANGEAMNSPDEVLLEGYTISKREPKSETSPELKKIEALRSAAVITDDEYEMMKARILTGVKKA